ncbi:sugar phosphate isomerase/epimerase family protein [Terracidiphilus sp.]|uniref:sugar phosphate isomerase/epimerase family protein n=1 Tax=Terracidiphilus sp. TaxID=1964191 RepID=UPI003C1F97EB
MRKNRAPILSAHTAARQRNLPCATLPLRVKMACTQIDKIIEAQMTASISRREFVRIGAAAAAATAGASYLSAAEVKAPLGLQLYSVRELLPKDFDGTLAKLAPMGYKNVEAAGYYNKTAAEWRAAMDKAGLRCTSTHHPLPMLKQHEDEYIEFAHTAGIEYIVCPSPMKKDPSVKGPMTLDDWKWSASELNRIGGKVKSAGIRLGYHNHTPEFETLDGVLVYDELLRDTDPKLVFFEMDCGWVKAAGQDPLTWLTKTPERFPLLHVKDMEKKANGQSHSTIMGKGYIDYRPILRAAKGLKQYFVEQEEFQGDILDELRQDAEYMKNFRY